jgi:hypothetical protein
MFVKARSSVFPARGVSSPVIKHERSCVSAYSLISSPWPYETMALDCQAQYTELRSLTGLEESNRISVIQDMVTTRSYV